MLDSICTLPLTSDLFTQSIHPAEPLLAVGLASGHVQTLRLPPAPSSDDDDDEDGIDGVSHASSNGLGHIDTEWRTRRHKGSCRSVAYSYDGGHLFSAGTDGLVKAAATATGQVVSKIAMPLNPANDTLDAPTLVHALSPQTLLLATDSSALHLYDLRVAPNPTKAPSKVPQIFSKPQQTHYPHADYVSSLTPLPPSAESTSGFSKQWITTGGTNLAITDLRKGVLATSADLEDEVLSSAYVTGLGKRGTSVGAKAIVGGAGGWLSLYESGVWGDLDERICVDGGGESLDCISVVPQAVGYNIGLKGGKSIAVGLGDGRIRFVEIGQNMVVGECQHSNEMEGVVAIGFEVGGRMISGGGNIVKVWEERAAGEDDDEMEEEDVIAGGSSTGKRAAESDSDDSDEDSSEGEQGRKRRKKRKRNRGKKDGVAAKSAFNFAGLD